MDFKNYINTEEATIAEFVAIHKPITLNGLMNESFSKFDFTFYSAGTPNQYYTPQVDGVCEVKTRNFNSTNFPEGTIIELDKLQGVLKEVSKQKSEFENINKTIKGFYLTKYLDKTFLFDLESIDFGQIEYMKLPKATASNGNNGYHTKAVFIIPYDKAVLSY